MFIQPEDIPTTAGAYVFADGALVAWKLTDLAAKRAYNKISKTKKSGTCGWATIDGDDRSHGFMIWS